MKRIFLLVLFVCIFCCADEWTELMQFRKPEGNLTFGIETRPGEPPISLRVSGEKGSAVITIENGKWNVKCVDKQGTALKLPQPIDYTPAATAPEYEIMLKFRDDAWAYYVNGVLCGESMAPLRLEGCKLEWPSTSQVAVKKAMDFQITSRPDFQTDFMIEPGAKDELQPWHIQYGNWHIHTALQESIVRPETNQGTMQRTPPSADKSPNFYSLKGSGKNEEAVLTTGSDLYDKYTLTASMQPEAGEVGIVFLHRGEGKEASFYALTLYRDNEGEARLWKQEKGVRTMLARVAIPLYNKQWYLPGVSLRNGEIIATLDKAELFRYRGELPFGGKIGLYAKTPEETRFDDVTLKPFSDIPFESANDISGNMLFSTPGIVIPQQTAPQISLPHAFYTVNMQRGATDEMMILGHPDVDAAVFSTQVTGNAAGVIAGWRGTSEPYYLFKRTKADKNAQLELVRFAPGGSSVVDTFTVPWNDTAELLTEIGKDGILRCCCDDVLVFKRGEVKPGAAGIFIPAGETADSVQFSQMQLLHERVRTHELKQKNVVFEHDPFMRHWAAAEGQWIGGGDDIMYHKGDFFGDFTMELPYVINGEIHLGLPDSAKEGALKLFLGEKEVRMTGPDDFDKAFAVESPKLAQKISVNLEGYYLEIAFDGKVLCTRRLNAPLRSYGTRLLTRKYNSEIMKQSKVVRMNVIDDFFNESPHDWSVNGGDWQIINRFQCTASWSHMISHSLNTMAAFWRKQRFQGDMTLEFYAGTRHEYYDKSGNMNCTIMAQDNTASSGYTATCSEWDQNKSQNWTYLYKNAKRINRSDAYMIPRRREGLYRRILNPLIAAGRDYHGAWYYIKLRKIGHKLEYWFDDELVMTSQDDEPLTEGTLGIWTFDHSMTLAQIKITYEKAWAKKHNVVLLPTEIPPAVEAKPAEHWTATANGFPLNAMEPQYWQYSDSVAQGKTMPFAVNTDGITLHNNLGAGSMTLSAKLPDIKLTDVAGFRFRVKRSATAQFNFFYTIVKFNDKKDAEIEKQFYFHQLSADNFSQGLWKMTGSTEVKPDQWQEVTVWLPASVRRDEAQDSNRVVRIGGFGIEQFDFMSSGISGNTPGAEYSICDFRPIFYKQPEVALGEKVRANARAQKEYNATARNPMTADAKQLAEQLAKCSEKQEIANAFVDLKAEKSALTAQLTWLVLPKELPLTVKWHPTLKDTIAVTTSQKYADYRINSLKLLADGQELKFIRNDSEAYAVYHLQNTHVNPLELELQCNDANKHFSLPMDSKERRNAAPLLMKIDGYSPMWLGFNDAKVQAPLQSQAEPRMKMEYDDNGAYLHISNIIGQGGLRSIYSQKYSTSEYPLFYFKYNADDMCNVSIIYPHGNHVRLADQSSRESRNVRFAKTFTQDGKWHNWIGFTPDVFVNKPYTPDRYIAGNFSIATGYGQDHTGAFSNLKLDDITLGPAVNSPEKLAFTPQYFDVDGVDFLEYAIFSGADTYDGQEIASWIRVKPDEKITPVFPENIQDGVHHILLRAADRSGNVSQITDLPFLLDRAQPTVSGEVLTTYNVNYNGKLLRVNVGTSNGAPLCLDKVGYKLNGAEIKMPNWSSEYERSATADVPILNYPLAIRKQLNDAKDGDVLNFQVCNIQDGAGNKCEDLTVPIKINYAEDKRGPNWFNFDAPKNYIVMRNWDGNQNGSRFMRNGGNQETQVVNEIGKSSYLIHYSYYGNADLSTNVNWDIGKNNYIAFRCSTTTARGGLLVKLVLTCTDNKQYVISLTQPTKENNELNRTQSCKWENNKWLHFIFNVKEMLTAIGVKDAEKIKIKTICFLRQGIHHRDTLLLDDLCIFGTENPDAQWRIVPFDVSGVASIDAYTYEGDTLLKSYPTSKHDQYNFNEFKTDKPRWIKIVARDKAGNFSSPCYIPLPAK